MFKLLTADYRIYIVEARGVLTWRIALPESMLQSTIEWYHIVTGHPGSKKLRLTLDQRYHHPEMRRYIDIKKNVGHKQGKVYKSYEMHWPWPGW